MRKVNPELHEKLLKLINSMGYEFVGGEVLPMGGRTVIRIYIDSEKGVTVEDCSLVSRQVGAMMDVEEPVKSRYTLEVSSPGIDRQLFEILHYQKFIGSQVKIRLTVPLNKRRQYSGILQQVVGEDIHLLMDDTGQEVILPFSAIEKANIKSRA